MGRNKLWSLKTRTKHYRWFRFLCQSAFLCAGESLNLGSPTFVPLFVPLLALRQYSRCAIMEPSSILHPQCCCPTEFVILNVDFFAGAFQITQKSGTVSLHRIS